MRILGLATKFGVFRSVKRINAVTSPAKLRPVEPSQRPNFSLAGAGGTLIGMTAGVMVLATLVGWALGSWSWGLIVGVIVGIPVGIAVVIRQYGNA